MMLWPRLVLIALPLAGCGLPRDPEATSERIAATHELRAGISDNAPWVVAAGEPAGIEPELIRKFAASLGARVVWTRDTETDLVEALHEHRLDVVSAGLDKKAKWVASAGVTQPYAIDGEGKKRLLLAVPGENGFLLALDRFLTAQKAS